MSTGDWAVFWEESQNDGYPLPVPLYDAHLLGDEVLSSNTVQHEEGTATGRGYGRDEKVFIYSTTLVEDPTGHIRTNSMSGPAIGRVQAQSEARWQGPPITASVNVEDLTEFVGPNVAIEDQSEFIEADGFIEDYLGEIIGAGRLEDEYTQLNIRAHLFDEHAELRARADLQDETEDIRGTGSLKDLLEEVTAHADLLDEYEELRAVSDTDDHLEKTTAQGRLEDHEEEVTAHNDLDDQQEEIMAQNQVLEEYADILASSRALDELSSAAGDSRVEDLTEFLSELGTGEFYENKVEPDVDVAGLAEFIQHDGATLSDASISNYVIPVFEADLETAVRVYNPNIIPVIKAKSEFAAEGLYNPNIGVVFENETRYEVHTIRNPNLSVTIEAESDYNVLDIKLIPGVEVMTLPDQRSQEFIQFKLDLKEVGHRDTARIYWEYTTNVEKFTKHGAELQTTEAQEVGEADTYDSEKIEPPHLDTEKDYYYRAVGETVEDGEVISQHKGSVVRSFRTSFTSGGGRYENYIDARDLEDADALLQRGRERLANKGEIQKVELEYNEAGPYTFIEDFEVGDWVRVEYPGIFAEWMRIVEIVEEVTDEGRYLELRFGDRSRTIVDVIEEHRKEVDAELRY